MSLCKCFESRANSLWFAWRLTTIIFVYVSPDMPLHTLYNNFDEVSQFGLLAKFNSLPLLNLYFLFHSMSLFALDCSLYVVIICTYRLSGARQLILWRQLVAIKKFFSLIHCEHSHNFHRNIFFPSTNLMYSTLFQVQVRVLVPLALVLIRCPVVL